VVLEPTRQRQRSELEGREAVIGAGSCRFCPQPRFPSSVKKRATSFDFFEEGKKLATKEQEKRVVSMVRLRGWGSPRASLRRYLLHVLRVVW
jgi:hypothetical protein